MKLFTFLLAFTILTLTIKPCVDIFSLNQTEEIGCCAGACSSNKNKDTSENQPDKENDCSDKNCNPFQICGAFVVHSFSDPLEGFVHPEKLIEHLFHYNSTFTSQFKPDFWQPPKIV